jgi:ribosome-associated protein
VASSGSLLVAVGASGTIQTSTDGTTWTARTADGGYTGTFQCVRYDATSASWLATGDAGEVQYSTNGTSWTFVEGSQPTSAYVQCCPHPSGGWIIAKLDTTSNLLYIRKSTLASPAGFSAVTNFAAADTSLSRMVVGCDDRRVVIASGDSNRQTKALAANVRNKLKDAGAEVIGVEGESVGEWILVDLGKVIVHIMQPTIRAHYNLEELWAPPPRARRRAPGAAASEPVSGPVS